MSDEFKPRDVVLAGGLAMVLLGTGSFLFQMFDLIINQYGTVAASMAAIILGLFLVVIWAVREA